MADAVPGMATREKTNNGKNNAETDARRGDRPDGGRLEGDVERLRGPTGIESPNCMCHRRWGRCCCWPAVSGMLASSLSRCAASIVSVSSAALSPLIAL